MKNQDFGRLLEQRTTDFAIRIIKFSTSLSKSIESGVVRNQLTKSATSIGANYREANRSRSNRDFSNKLKICESEAAETAHWLN
jgi:four helix bundle protein